jgi:hypothetical protein
MEKDASSTTNQGESVDSRKTKIRKKEIYIVLPLYEA